MLKGLRVALRLLFRTLSVLSMIILPFLAGTLLKDVTWAQWPTALVGVMAVFAIQIALQELSERI